jgi:hypothetical protein
MAARRLLIVMLLLLGLSTLVGGLISQDALREGAMGTTETEQTESVPVDTVPAGKDLEATMRADSGRVQVVRLVAGDQLSLKVTSGRFDQVEIPGLGLLGAVGPSAPAHFELLAEAAESYGVRLVQADRLIGRIEVRERVQAPPAETTSRARAEPGPA